MRSTTLALAFVSALACGSEGSPEEPQLPRDAATYWPDTAWRRATPAQVGIDPAPLTALVQKIRRGDITDIASLVVVRHGYLVTEEYFNGSSRTDVHTMQSVSKSVTSLVTGIAIDNQKLSATSQIFSVMPEYARLATGDARKQQITVRDLLQMRAGINFYESPYAGSPLQRLNDSRGDWVEIALGEPMNAAPGERWQYNSGGVIALASAVQHGTGAKFTAYARDRLFTPLGITSQYWYISPFDSLAHAGGGLNVSATDLARIGYLVLRDGVWKGQRIVSSSWLAASTTPYSTNVANYGGYRQDYGYLWWLMPLDGSGATGAKDATIYAAIGNLGQFLFVVPRHELVVVFTGNGNGSFGAQVEALYRDLLPALRSP